MQETRMVRWDVQNPSNNGEILHANGLYIISSNHQQHEVALQHASAIFAIPSRKFNMKPENGTLQGIGDFRTWSSHHF